MSSWLIDVIFPFFRWLHIVCTTLIVGGTLFFELVLPIAIEDLKSEERLLVMARARWVFRWVVWIGVIGLLLSGLVNMTRAWQLYQAVGLESILRWAISHVLIGAIAMVVALSLIIGRRPPSDPVRWMRLDLILLLVTIFLGCASRHFEMVMHEREQAAAAGKLPPTTVPVVEAPTTQAMVNPVVP